MELSACYAKGRAGNADKRRWEVVFYFAHRKERKVRKGNVTVTLRSLRSLRFRNSKISNELNANLYQLFVDKFFVSCCLLPLKIT